MHARSIPLAKLAVPRLPDVAPRERLFRQLEAIDTRPCVWVCGPAGSGKTTLVADYLRRRETPCAWFLVDAGDADASATIAYLIELAGQASATAPRLPYLTAERRLDLPGFFRLFFRQFFQCLPDDCTVVFDNCHLAAGEQFDGLLRGALEEAPPDKRLFAISRRALPDALARGQANRQVAVIGAEDLRLDAEESRAVVSAMGMDAACDVDALHATCDGWVAGLILAASHMREGQHRDRSPGLDLRSRESVFNYFATESFLQADPALRDLLLRTSLLPSFTATDARDLTGNERAGDSLETLYRYHYFTMRREDGEGVTSYAYHDLFRAFLQDRLEVDLTPDAVTELRLRVAEILVRSGAVPEAIAQYKLAKRWGDVARLLQAHGQRFIDQGQVKTLADCMTGLPVEVIRADPWILYMRGHAVATSAPDEAAQCLETAYEMFRAGNDVAGEFSAALATMETMMMKSASYEPWDRWIEALGCSLELHAPEDPGLAVRAWYTLLYTTLYRQPGHRLIRQAVAVLTRELFAGGLRATQAVQAATGLLAYAHFACDESLAEQVMPVMHRLLEDEDVAVMSRSLGSAWMTVYLYFDARYRDALRAADAAIELAQRHGLDAIARAQFWYRVQSLAHLGLNDDALALLADLNLPEQLSPNSFVGAYAATSSALVYFVAGDIATAIRLGQQGLDAWNNNGFTTARLGWAQSMQAVYLMTAGEIDGALRLVDEARSLLSGTECTYPFALHEAMHAYASLIRGRRSAAVELLQRCFALADNHKRLAILSWAKPLLPPLLALAWEEGIARATVAELISAWGLAPPSPDETHWPRPIEIRMLGAFEVRTHGAPVSFGRKPPRKPLAMLKAVAMSGDRGISVETARSWFWPDSDGDAAVGAQSAALYRLRKILGSAEAVRLEEGRLSLDPALVWVDVTAFQRLAASQSEQDGFRALSLYRGPLLPHDEDAPWAIATRLQLRDVFGRLVERLGLALETTDPEAAAALYLRGIETEPLSEASYRGLMRCHASHGHSAEAAAVSRRLRQTLSVVLGIGPSTTSEDLHWQILRSGSP